MKFLVADDHPLYREFAQLAHIRTSHRALTRGLQTIRFSSDKPGLFAVSRFDPDSGREMVLLFNTSMQPVHQHVRVVRAQRLLNPADQIGVFELAGPGIRGLLRCWCTVTERRGMSS